MCSMSKQLDRTGSAILMNGMIKSKVPQEGESIPDSAVIKEKMVQLVLKPAHLVDKNQYKDIFDEIEKNKTFSRLKSRLLAALQ